MFGIGELRRELGKLKDENKRLRERVEQLEISTSPLYVGEPLLSHDMWYPGWQDSRPKVTMHYAIKHIMAHLKIKFTATEAVPQRIDVENVKC